MPKEEKMSITGEVSAGQPTVFPQKKNVLNIKDMIREFAKEYADIKLALLAKDNSSFLLLGDIWTPELSKGAAELAVRISSNNEKWVNGGYRDSLQIPNDMSIIFERQ
jgi:hypothetical protein